MVEPTQGSNGVVRLGRARSAERTDVVVEHGGAYFWLSKLLRGERRDREMSEVISDWENLRAAIESGVGEARDANAPDDLELLAPIIPSKLVCVGANYAAHNAEMLGEVRDPFPFAFLKPPSTTVVGDGATVALPAYAEQVDYEGELALVMAGPGRIFGYTVLNDLSTRDWVPATSPLGIDWLVSKCFDGSAPMGPLITPREYIPNPDDLDLRLWVNDELRQDANTSGMVFSVGEMVSHVSRVLTLEPGDVIATGTPAGVGAGMKPPVWLRPGDVVRVEIEGLGRLATTIGERNDPSQMH